MVGCAVRTECKMQAIDAGCAWRTLQTSPYRYAVILRINQSFPKAAMVAGTQDTEHSLGNMGISHIRFFLLIVLLPFTAAQAGEQRGAGTVPDPRIDEAIALMHNYAERTGLASEQPRRRYLWTDAFAVCNYLGLARSSGGPASGR